MSLTLDQNLERLIDTKYNIHIFIYSIKETNFKPMHKKKFIDIYLNIFNKLFMMRRACLTYIHFTLILKLNSLQNFNHTSLL